MQIHEIVMYKYENGEKKGEYGKGLQNYRQSSVWHLVQNVQKVLKMIENRI